MDSSRGRLRPNERPMTYFEIAVHPDTRTHAACQQPCVLCWTRHIL
jgi:hypothetical protein